MLVGYIREIPDVEFVMEIIGERFDDAVNFMTEGSVIYGGAVRDALAGLPIEGDLDLAVSRHEFISICNAFTTASKWVKTTNGKKAKDYGTKEIRPMSTSLTMKLLAAAPEPRMSGSSRLYTIETFRNLHGMEAQLLVPSLYGENPLDEAMSLARDVDIVCCGVLMTRDGRVFEVVPGAYEDCVKRVLRFNDEADPLHIKALPKRVEKLMGRGWTSEIDVRSVMVKASRARRKKEKSEPEAKTVELATEVKHEGRFVDYVKSSKAYFGEDHGTLTGGDPMASLTVKTRLTAEPADVAWETTEVPVANSYKLESPFDLPEYSPEEPQIYNMSIAVRQEFVNKACHTARLTAIPEDSDVNIAINSSHPISNVHVSGTNKQSVMRTVAKIQEYSMRAETEIAFTTPPTVMPHGGAGGKLMAALKPRPYPAPRFNKKKRR